MISDAADHKFTASPTERRANPGLNSDEVRGFYNFARELHNAYHDREQHRFDHRRYRPIVLEGKTVCVVGAGGIGRDVGHLCASVGMRVMGTRRRATHREGFPPGLARLESTDRLHALLPESDCVAVCCQCTPETTEMHGPEAFAAMKSEPSWSTWLVVKSLMRRRSSWR